MINISYSQYPEILAETTIPSESFPNTSLNISIISVTDESIPPITTQYLQLKSIDSIDSLNPIEVILNFSKDESRDILTLLRDFMKQMV